MTAPAPSVQINKNASSSYLADGTYLCMKVCTVFAVALLVLYAPTGDAAFARSGGSANAVASNGKSEPAHVPRAPPKNDAKWCERLFAARATYETLEMQQPWVTRACDKLLNICASLLALPRNPLDIIVMHCGPLILAHTPLATLNRHSLTVTIMQSCKDDAFLGTLFNHCSTFCTLREVTAQ
jgi:hypothetical protein